MPELCYLANVVREIIRIREEKTNFQVTLCSLQPSGLLGELGAYFRGTREQLSDLEELSNNDFQHSQLFLQQCLPYCKYIACTSRLLVFSPLRMPNRKIELIQYQLKAFFW